MMQYGRLAIGVMFAAVSTSSAFAAPATAPSGRQFDVSLTGQIEYDDNLPRTSAAEALKRKLFQDDITYAPSLGLDLRLPVGGREAIFFNGIAGYVYHARS